MVVELKLSKLVTAVVCQDFMLALFLLLFRKWNYLIIWGGSARTWQRGKAKWGMWSWCRGNQTVRTPWTPLYFFRTLDFQQFIFDKVESWKTTLHAFFVSKAFISNTGIKLGIKRSWNKHYKLKTSWVKSIIATASIHY